MKYQIVYLGDTAKYKEYIFRLDKVTGYYLSTKKIGTKKKKIALLCMGNRNRKTDSKRLCGTPQRS